MDIVCLGEVLIDMFPAELGRSLVDVSALAKPNRRNFGQAVLFLLAFRRF